MEYCATNVSLVQIQLFYFGAITPIKSGEDVSFPASPASELYVVSIVITIRFPSHPPLPLQCKIFSGKREIRLRYMSIGKKS